jgi:hypothetical protein
VTDALNQWLTRGQRESQHNSDAQCLNDFSVAGNSRRGTACRQPLYYAASNDHSLTVVARQHLTEAQAPSRDREGVRMALWAADSDESRQARYGNVVPAWAVKVGSALDQSKP